MNTQEQLNPTWLKAVIADRFSLPFSICNTFEVKFLENTVNVLVSKENDLKAFKKDKLQALEKETQMAIVLGVK